MENNSIRKLAFIYEKKYNDTFVDRYNFVGDHYYQGFEDCCKKIKKKQKKYYLNFDREKKIILKIHREEIQELKEEIKEKIELIESLLKENRLLKLKEIL